MNRLYYGDNLHILREHVASESVDLIYLDPPFNSNASYNILFRSPSGDGTDAQIEAFGDTWEWGPEAEDAFHQVMRSGRTRAFELLHALRAFLGENAMMAYLAMMTVRLLELHRVLRRTGSLYLHCDPTASHYLKLLLDAVFGPDRFLSEIVWQRTSAHNSARRWGPVHDVILFYARSADHRWNRVLTAYDPDYVDRYYRHRDGNGRRYRLSDLTASGTRGGESGRAWGGFDPTAQGRHWAIPTALKEELGGGASGTHGWLDRLRDEGMVAFTGDAGGSGWPHARRFLDRMGGQAVQDVVTDIPPLSARHAERLGYPTQKPLALLERIIAASSDPGDVVLDPFCGCGTAVHAAQKLGRRWIGIDVTHLAVSLIERRMGEAFPDAPFDVLGRPQDLASAKELARRDKHEFQKWVVTHIGGQPWRGGRKGADGGIDGLIYFSDVDPATERARTARAIVSVKGGATRGVGMVADLIESIARNGAAIGILVMAAAPTREMERRAAAAGIHDTGLDGRFQRIQILTLADIFAGRRPRLPNIDRAMFRRAAREEGAGQRRLL